MIYVTGDTHGPVSLGRMSVDGYSRRLNRDSFPEQRKMTKEDYVIICGDFGGVWNFAMESREERYWLDWLDSRSFTTLFIPGNHENYDRLYGISDSTLLDSWLYDGIRDDPALRTQGYPQKDWHGGKVRKIRESVLMLERGYVFDIDGARCFCFGGARSHDISGGILDPAEYASKESFSRIYDQWKKQDRMFRVKGVSWWEKEFPDQREREQGLETLEKAGWNVDFVFTHDGPGRDKESLGLSDIDDFNRYLDEIQQQLTYKKWFFGHLHGNVQVNEKDLLLYEQIIRIR